MKLQNTNLSEWKKELDETMLRDHGIYEYSNTMSDDQWLDEFLGQTTNQAVESLSDSLND